MFNWLYIQYFYIDQSQQSFTCTLRGGLAWYVWLASILGPRLLKLMLKYLCSPLPREPGLIQAKLTHLEVILTGLEKQWFFIRMKLELTCYPLSVKVGVPPSLSAIQAVVLRRTDERNSEISLSLFYCSCCPAPSTRRSFCWFGRGGCGTGREGRAHITSLSCRGLQHCMQVRACKFRYRYMPIPNLKGRATCA